MYSPDMLMQGAAKAPRHLHGRIQVNPFKQAHTSGQRQLTEDTCCTNFHTKN
jgi:hypothetical protein